MTFDAIVDTVATKLNLTSDEAITRIGERVNRRYRRVTAAVGLVSTRRLTVTVDCDLDTRTQFADGIEKIISIATVDESPNRVIDEVTYEEMLNAIPNTDRVTAYAISRYRSGNVEFLMNFEPADALALSVEGYEQASDLADDQEPAFPESFHDLLYLGAYADELRKMEKQALARDAEEEFKELLGDLRMFIAKSSYLTLVQGKTAKNVVNDPLGRRRILL